MSIFSNPMTMCMLYNNDKDGGSGAVDKKSQP